ncbi:MAG: large-conductance mechanosensitive channel protein MscL [Oscillospiraceae bacterium]|nr:large-conductance mechanosensitive channel protein MscL [Oscillospiraceae bacterium]
MNKVKSFFGEFKEFISRGNVVDMAVGVVVGTSFTAIVNSLVKDVIMPLVGWIFGGIDFTSLCHVTAYAEDGSIEAAIYYGSFIQSIVNFLLVSLVVFSLVKLINRFHRKAKAEEAKAAEPAPEPQPSEEVLLLREIRDALKK